MTPADLDLPDDVDALKAMILAMAEKAARADALESEVADLKARNADADEQIAKLKQVLKAFDRYRYGRRSEKQSKTIDADLDEQGAFVFEEIETALPPSRRWSKKEEVQTLQNVHHVRARASHRIWNVSMW